MVKLSNSCQKYTWFYKFVTLVLYRISTSTYSVTCDKCKWLIFHKLRVWYIMFLIKRSKISLFYPTSDGIPSESPSLHLESRTLFWILWSNSWIFCFVIFVAYSFFPQKYLGLIDTQFLFLHVTGNCGQWRVIGYLKFGTSFFTPHKYLYTKKSKKKSMHTHNRSSETQTF